MRGLFEKDIRIIKNQKKMMLIFAGMGVLLLLSGVEISFILPYMASVMTSVLCMRIRSSFRTDRSYRLWDSSAG